MINMIWTLCVAVALVQAGPIRPTNSVGNKAAPQEELDVLMFGIVQLGDSVNYIYETTEEKMVKIHQALQKHQATLQRLEEKTEQAAEVKKQIKEVIQQLQSQMTVYQADIRLIRDLLIRMETEELKLRTKVKKLENYLNNALSIKELQERAEDLGVVLQTLQNFHQDLQEAIKTQNMQITKLQEMTNHRM